MAPTTFTPGSGTINPATLNNQVFIGLFASLGALMVIGALWFFFWAKNGGFVWQETDWDDYKSTVLRRKGPDGKTLSNATKSTKLGGSTIAGTQRYPWEMRMQAKSVVSYDEKGRKGVLGKRGWGKTHSVYYSDDFTQYSKSRHGGGQTISDSTESREEPTQRYYDDHDDHDEQQTHHSKRYKDRDVREYKRERPARVGGLNRVADGSGVESLNPSIVNPSTLAGSEVSHTSETPILHHHHQSNPPTQQHHSPPKKKKDTDRAARDARSEAAKMERRWKKEAEEAAAALARESIPAPKRAAAPTAIPSSSKGPSPPKHRQASRSSSPKKRDLSYGDAATEVMSTTYTATSRTESSGQRTTSASYYEAYRPKAEASTTYTPSAYAPTEQWRERGTEGRGARRESSPKKKAGGRSAGGYRRGADSDLE